MQTDWMAVFKTGTHTDSQGRTKTWTEKDLDLIVNKYKPSYHEAPVVIGHPQNNSPAWGWVDALKQTGGVLYAKLKNIVPEFAEMIDKGMFKKRSISLYQDLTLKHIGFLGVTPPAVKGLPDYAFSGSGGATIEFSEDSGLSGIKREIENIQKEEELIKEIAELTVREMQTDRTLPYDEAFKKIINRNPDILRKLEEMETELIRKKIMQGGIEGLLDILTKNKMENNKDLSFSMAFSEVQIENPELTAEYISRLRGYWRLREYWMEIAKSKE